MSKKKKPVPHEEEMGEAWLLPYSDLMTLLLAVFIVLFAVSQVDLEKTQAMAEAFGDEMMTESYVITKKTNQENNSSPGAVTTLNELDRMEEMKEILDTKLEDEHMTTSVTTKIDDRGLVVSLNNAFFFEPGSAQLKEEYKEALLGIASVIEGMEDSYIRIEGHTDNVPMNTDQYPSNWELSTARAVSVVRLFTGGSNITPERLLAVGYGEYRPVEDNKTEMGRAQNRRIDIIVLSAKYGDLEKKVSH